MNNLNLVFDDMPEVFGASTHLSSLDHEISLQFDALKVNFHITKFYLRSVILESLPVQSSHRLRVAEGSRGQVIMGQMMISENTRGYLQASITYPRVLPRTESRVAWDVDGKRNSFLNIDTQD